MLLGRAARRVDGLATSLLSLRSKPLDGLRAGQHQFGACCRQLGAQVGLAADFVSIMGYAPTRLGASLFSKLISTCCKRLGAWTASAFYTQTAEEFFRGQHVKAPVAAGSARRRPRRFVYVASLQPAWALIPFLDQLAPVQLYAPTRCAPWHSWKLREPCRLVVLVVVPPYLPCISPFVRSGTKHRNGIGFRFVRQRLFH
jgi:hypothetical protein